jgi:hypothetical protein
MTLSEFTAVGSKIKRKKRMGTSGRSSRRKAFVELRGGVTINLRAVI